MRGNISKVPNGYNSPLSHCKKPILLTLTLVLVTLIFLHYMHDDLSFLLRSKEDNVSISGPLYGGKKLTVPSQNHPVKSNHDLKNCNLFSGKWVPYNQGPYYTNESQCMIKNEQNCMKFGRPDTDYMKWRWKPDDCELPLFDATEFLEAVRGKSLGFIGDSLARNQMQSLGCLLSSVSRYVDTSSPKYPRVRQWYYADYNFTIGLLMTTHLVKTRGVNDLSSNAVDLFLDEAEVAWATHVEEFDFLIISGAHWFARPIMYYENKKLIGCNMCGKENITDLGRHYGIRRAFTTALRTVLEHHKPNGTIILRTITPPHFESEDLEGGGNCVRTKPYKKGEYKLDWNIWMTYLIQMEVFLNAKMAGPKRGLNFRLLDITEVMRPRADAHPNHYGHPSEERFMLYSDCLHWCMPGAIDTWNEFLLQIVKAPSEGLI